MANRWFYGDKMQVYLVVLYDRHCDDEYYICFTKESAHERVEKFVESYKERYEWSVPKWVDSEDFVRYLETDDEGPKAFIKIMDVE